MFYSSFGILALVLHLIINNEVLRKRRGDITSTSTLRYRSFLYSVMIYYVSDIIWGFLNEYGFIRLVYADTMIYFASMALSLLVWTHYVVEFTGRKNARSKALIYAGWFIFIFVLLHLAVNFFNPVIFDFTPQDGYVPGRARYWLLGVLFLLHLVLCIYSFIISARSEGKDKIHYRALGVSCLVMSAFISLQMMYELLPFYAIGLLVSTCLIHVFVEEDEKLEMDRKLHSVEKQAEREHKKTEKAEKEKKIYNHIAESLAEEYEAIYYIEIETGKYKEFSPSQMYQSMKVPKNCENFYKETQENVMRFAHPDDRKYALSLYTKEVMLEHLAGKRSYSYRYRVMVGGQPRYFRFDVILAKDGKHFVLCDKDVQDEITEENALRENQKKSITFAQIAESLASNYDVIYYVNINDGNYVGYNSRNIYGQLDVDRSGDDFFTDTRANIPKIVHPQDCERMMEFMDRDHLLSALEDRKQISFKYRLIIGDSSQYTRVSIRRSSDGVHFIIGVENIDDEIMKEKEHLKALNTEKELARRDELTGIKNKTAYSELEQSVQSNIDNGVDYLPFAIAVCDVNDLKKINDTEGHKAGDEYIRSASKLLCDIFDHSPVFRVGGDEFVVFLRGDDYNNREDLILRLHEQVMTNILNEDGPVIASGMSEFDPEKDRLVSEVFERADNKMYEDKRNLKLHGGR